MRFLFLGIFVLLAAGYGAGAFFFYTQERAAQAEEPLELTSAPELRHPEAVLEAVRVAFETHNFSDEVLPYLDRALSEAPSFYQSPFLLAAFYANRMEKAELVRRGFEAALGRYPANGRLHLTFAQWLLDSSRTAPGGSADDRGKSHLKTALALEPELTGLGLALLRRHGTPPESWIEVVPETLPARRQLLLALARAGHLEEARNLLESLLETVVETRFLRAASSWALQWGRPDLALQAARHWREGVLASDAAASDLAQAVLQVCRVYLVLEEPDTAYEAFRDGLEEIEGRAGAASRAALELLNGMAYEYLRRGRTVMAESLFAEAVGLAPYQASSVLGLARTYRQTGDREAAMAQYRKVLELDPQNEPAEKELSQLILERELGRR